MLHVLFSVYLKMLVLYSPFFVLSCFISLTRGYSRKDNAAWPGKWRSPPWSRACCCICSGG